MFQDSSGLDLSGEHSSGLVRRCAMFSVPWTPVNRWPNFEPFQNILSSMPSWCCCDYCRPVLELPEELGFVKQWFLTLQISDKNPFQAHVLLACMFVCLLPCNTSHSVQCHSSRYSLRVALALSWLTHGSSQALLCIVQYILQHIGKSSDGVWNWPRVSFLRCQQTYHRCSLSQSGFGSSTARWPVLLYFKTLDVMSLIDWFLVWWTSWLMSDQWYHHPNAGQNLPLLP